MTPAQLTVFPRVPREGETLSKHKLAVKAGPDYKINPDTGCWEWQKFKCRGYGKCSWKGKSAIAHRVYYELAYGPIPAGHDVHHRCNNPGCVNPEHLEAISDRMHDIESFLKGRANGLTLADVLEIRRRGRIFGTRAEDVAKEFGIYWSTVYNYWSGDRRWAEFFGDDPGPAVPSDPCIECGGPVERGGRAALRVRKYCGPVCRDRFHRRKQRKAKP